MRIPTSDRNNRLPESSTPKTNAQKSATVSYDFPFGTSYKTVFESGCIVLGFAQGFIDTQPT